MSTDAKILSQAKFNEKFVYVKLTNLHGSKKMDFAGNSFSIKKVPLGSRK